MNSMADAIANGVAAEHAPVAAHSWPDADAARSRELSRARTIHAALERLGLLDAGDARVGGDLRLALVGADDREGSTPAASAAALGALAALLEHGPWRSILVLLVGPNCAGAEAETFAPAVAATATAPALLVRYARRAYEDVEPPFFPHAAFAFQAGFWGYDTWRPASRSSRATAGRSAAAGAGAPSPTRGARSRASRAPPSCRARCTRTRAWRATAVRRRRRRVSCGVVSQI